MSIKNLFKRKKKAQEPCVVTAGDTNNTTEFEYDERGVITTETIIMIAVVAIVAVTVFQIMNTMLPALFKDVIDRISQMVAGRILP